MPAETIRPAEHRDIPAIQRVASKSWHAAYAAFLDDQTIDDTIDDWYDAEGLSACVESDDQLFYVAETDDAIAGFVNVGPGGDGDSTYVLYRIYVDPEYWDEGVGRALLSRVEPELRAAGVEAIELTVFANNEVGVSFYESTGFERVATRRDEFDGERHREFVYRKDL